MMVIQRCQWLGGCARLLKHHAQSSQTKDAAACACLFKKDSTAYLSQDRRSCRNKTGMVKTLTLHSKDSGVLTGFASANLQQRRDVSLAARAVNSSSPKVQPYLKLMRIDRPIGSWLLFWPCAWSTAMAAPAGALPDLHLLAIFGIGAFVMRGAGCTINDMWDQDIDGLVARTKDRPLVTGEISPLQAMTFLGGQLTVGLLVLLQLNWYSIILGTSSLVLVIMYPVMKRITYYPQLILGMTFNWGALLGWSAVQGSCNWAACLPLYAAGICWTILYDTIYAHQDKVDDIVVGVKSTALKFGDNTKLYISGLGAVMITGLITSGILTVQTWPYYLAVSLVSTHLAKQIYTLDTNNSADCAKKFISNHRVGMILFAGIVLGNLMKKPLSEDEAEEKRVDAETEESLEDRKDNRITMTNNA